MMNSFTATLDAVERTATVMTVRGVEMNLQNTIMWALMEKIKAESLKEDAKTPYRMGYIQALKDIISVIGA